jgi:protein CpxP
MKPVRILSIVAVLLMLVNGFLVLHLVTKNDRNGPPHPPKHVYRLSVIEALQFDETQIEAYDKLIQEHLVTMMKLEEIRGQKLAVCFDVLKTDDPSLSNSDLKELEQIERERIMVTHKHFADIKALCRPDQLAAFEEVLQKAVQMLAGRPSRPERNPRR